MPRGARQEPHPEVLVPCRAATFVDEYNLCAPFPKHEQLENELLLKSQERLGRIPVADPVRWLGVYDTELPIPVGDGPVAHVNSVVLQQARGPLLESEESPVKEGLDEDVVHVMQFLHLP